MAATLPHVDAAVGPRDRRPALSAASGGCGGRTPGPGGGPRRRSSASAQTWVTGSSGSGRASTQPSSWSDLHPVDQHELAVLGLLDQRCASPAPFCSHGVTTRLVDHVDLRAAPSTTSDSCVPVRASRSSTFTSAAAASKAGRKPGQDEPAVAVGGEADAGLGRPRPSARRSTASCRRTLDAALLGAARSACRVTFTGSAMRSPRRWSRDQRRRRRAAPRCR